MTLNDHMLDWFKGDPQAVEFALVAWDVAQAWDDVVDDGRSDEAPSLLEWLAFGQERHPFFARHAADLRPVLLKTYLDWQAANELENGRGADLAKAYVLRASIYGLWHFMAMLCGGIAWAKEVGPAIWGAYGEHLCDFMIERRPEMEALHA